MHYQRYDRLHRWILSPANLATACAAVVRRGGSPGIDDMSTDKSRPGVTGRRAIPWSCGLILKNI